MVLIASPQHARWTLKGWRLSALVCAWGDLERFASRVNMGLRLAMVCLGHGYSGSPGHGLIRF